MAPDESNSAQSVDTLVDTVLTVNEPSQDMTTTFQPSQDMTPAIHPTQDLHITQTIPDQRRSIMSVLHMASDISYTTIGAIVVIFVGLALVVNVAWFMFDLTHLTHTPPVGISSSAFMRDQVISALVNFLANLVLVLILIEVVTALTSFFRTRKMPLRPILLIPLFVLMRGVIIFASQLLVTSLSAGSTLINSEVIKIMAEMGAFALVGLIVSASLGLIRERDGGNSQK